LSTDGVIHGHHLPPTLQIPDASQESAPSSLRSRISVLEKDAIIDALKRTEGNVTAAARDLGLTPRMIRYKIVKLAIDYKELFDRTAKKTMTSD
jgi:Nif-specific regulatory protein